MGGCKHRYIIQANPFHSDFTWGLSAMLIGVTLALQIRDGLRERASLLDLNDSIAKVLRRRRENDACCRSSFVVGEEKITRIMINISPLYVYTVF